MKKTLLSFVSVMILTVVLSAFCYADSFAPIITVQDGHVGDTVEVTLAVPGGTTAVGGSFNLIYDNTKLEIVEASAGPLVAAMTKNINTAYAANKIRMNFASTENISADGGVALKVSFKLLAEGTAELSTEKFKLLDFDTNSLSCTNSTASILITAAPAVVAVTGVTLDKSEATLTVREKTTLTATVLPADATDKSVTWTTSDANIATVANGVVTAVAPGTATITVTTADGGKTASCTVTVNAAAAENEPTIVVGAVKGRIGKTVDVTIDIKNNPGIISMLLRVSYDKENLTLTKVTNGDVLNCPYHNLNDLSRNPYTLSWGDDIATENNKNNGTIVTFTFRINDNAAVGVYPVTVTYDNTDAGIYDMDFNLIDFAVVNGSVEVRDYIPGDLNDDEQVNSFDRTTLARHIASWAGYEPETFVYEAADVNEDGSVNAFDRTILARYIAEWADYPELPINK